MAVILDVWSRRVVGYASAPSTGGQLVGTALTVRVRSGQNLAIHQALNITRAGDVLVIDGGGDTRRALVGEIMEVIAEMA